MRTVSIVALACALAIGCGDSRPMGSQPTTKDALAEIGQMLKVLAEEGKKPPTKVAELEPVEPLIQTALPLIRDGSLVYLWGTPYAANGEKVVAYEKKAPTEGGLVLLQGGTVKEMSATEFRAAPKTK